MKMSKEAFAHMKAEIDKVLEKHNANGELVARYERGEFPRADQVKDLQMRFCYDLFNAANLSNYACEILYPAGLNDDHIYTALKSMCPKVDAKNAVAA